MTRFLTCPRPQRRLRFSFFASWSSSRYGRRVPRRRLPDTGTDLARSQRSRAGRMRRHSRRPADHHYTRIHVLFPSPLGLRPRRMSPSPTPVGRREADAARADRTTRFASRMPRLVASCLKGRRPPAGAPTPCKGRRRSVWVLSRNSVGANSSWGRWMESDSPDGAKRIHLLARRQWVEDRMS